MLSLLCQNQFGKHLAALCTVHFPVLCQVTISTEFTTAFSLSNQRLLSHPGRADYHGARRLGNPKTNGLSYSGFQSILFGNQEDGALGKLSVGLVLPHTPLKFRREAPERLERKKKETAHGLSLLLGTVFNSKGSEMWITLSLSLDLALLSLNML